MAVLFDLSLPVTSNSIGSMDYMSSESTDLANIGVDIGIWTMHSKQAYILFTSS